MQMYEIISKKRDKKKLTQEEIEYFVSGYTKGQIPDYQASALLMAVFLNGMDVEETFHLTLSMMNSGRVLDLSSVPGVKVDKHSTGGVGDKVSLILAPLVASCGVKVPMISGRGLGHTGGTLDKLESIPGFRIDLSLRRFRKILSDVWVCMIGQTKEIAPADRKMYALRDVTATVNCIPLIASSIMSKKLAEGADAFIFDVKVGNGAFMQEQDEAELLAENLIQIAKEFKKKAVALITDMNEPLGEAVGNSIEVVEAIQALKGKAPSDLMKVTLALSAHMLILGKKAKNLKEAEKKCHQAIRTGQALKKFREMITKQGGNLKVLDDYRLLPWGKHKLVVNSDKDGYVQSIDTRKIGLSAMRLGAGREKMDSPIDPGVGFLIKKKVGDTVKKGETLALVFANNINKGKLAGKEIKEAYRIGKRKTSRLKKILLFVDEKGARKLNCAF
ncbi:MAG: thymidine phosphorylase [candidate division Zixibacteria bacterium]|nr:thymidine phosphorylase [candidate division Zixibacteria bacterium]